MHKETIEKAQTYGFAIEHALRKARKSSVDHDEKTLHIRQVYGEFNGRLQYLALMDKRRNNADMTSGECGGSWLHKGFRIDNMDEEQTAWLIANYHAIMEAIVCKIMTRG